MTLRVHPGATVSDRADIEDSVLGTLIEFGEGVVVDSFVKIKPAGGRGDFTVGRRSQINSGCVFYTGNGIRIGENVMIAANCTFAPTNHAYADLSRPMIDQGFLPSKGGILIEDDVWIGANCVLLDGAVVRSGAILAAGSVVRGELAGNTIHAGAPAKPIRSRAQSSA